MKKTLVSFTISFACLIGFCAFANADVVQSWSITTDVDAWKMAKLLKSSNQAINSTKDEIHKTVFNNYLNGYSTVVNPDKTLSAGVLSYENVKQSHITTTIPDGFNNTALTPLDGITGTWNHYGDIQTLDYIYSPGYYAFQTTFSLSPEVTDLSGLFLNIDLDMTADDWLEGIFLNGHEITEYGANGANGGIGHGYTIELTGSILLDDLIGLGLFLADGVNTLDFVVGNESISSNKNPFHFAALGDINIGDQQFDHSFSSTPEPATLLICLTCGGLALAIRRRRNKKTE
ncbi:MAG: hypothetical protein LBP59_13855 [Planctomycetaceae bacterium]|jgi:hypothetical protein|nr:hypothetical protein [Planctomycetaceae bacterium]